MKLKKIIKIKNKLGLHIRPAAAIVKLLQPFKSDVIFECNKMRANGKSIMSILTLMAKRNAELVVTVEGLDAKEALKELEDGFNNCFGDE